MGTARILILLALGTIAGILLPDIQIHATLPFLVGVLLLGVLIGVSLFRLQGEPRPYLDVLVDMVRAELDRIRAARPAASRKKAIREHTGPDQLPAIRPEPMHPIDLPAVPGFGAAMEAEESTLPPQRSEPKRAERQTTSAGVIMAFAFVVGAFSLVFLVLRDSPAVSSIASGISEASSDVFKRRPAADQHDPTIELRPARAEFASEDERRRKILRLIRLRKYSEAEKILRSVERPLDLEERKLLLPAMYGQGRYRESLALICDYMKDTPGGLPDVAFNPYLENLAISARALAKTSGTEPARLVLGELRARCGVQFSDVWLGISTSQTAKLFEGKPRFTHEFEVRREDKDYLEAYRASASESDPFRRLADYYLDDFETVASTGGPFHIGLFAEIDDAVMVGSDEDRIKKLGAVIGSDLEIAERFSVLKIDPSQLYGAMCKLTLRANDFTFSTRIVERGQDHEYCLAGIVNVFSSDSEGEKALELFDLIAGLPETDKRSILGSIIEARVVFVDRTALEPELERLGFESLSGQVRDDIIHRTLPTMLEHWGTKETLAFLKRHGPATGWKRDNLPAGFQNALVDVAQSESFDTALEFIYYAAGLYPDAINIALAHAGSKLPGDQAAEDEREHDPYEYTRYLYNVADADIPDLVRLIQRSEAAFTRWGSPAKDIQVWKDNAHENLAARAYYALSRSFDEGKERLSPADFEAGYTSARSAFTTPSARSAFDRAVARELIEIVAVQASRALVAWDIEGAKDLFAYADILLKYVEPEEVGGAAEQLLAARAEYARMTALGCDNLIDIAAERRNAGPLLICLKKKPDSERKGRVYYLLASIQRQAREYETSRETMERFIKEIPAHDLRDDILAELGWIEFRAKNYNKASSYFQTIIEQYPDRNAADNAYYWLGKVSEARGLRDAAGEYYTIIALKEGADRLRSLVLRDKSQGRRTVRDIYLVEKWTKDLYVDQVSADEEEVPKFLQKGDQLVSVCGKAVSSILDVTSAMAYIPSAKTSCEVTIVRELSMNTYGEVTEALPVVSTQSILDERNSRKRQRD
jgi:hypothetical protein